MNSWPSGLSPFLLRNAAATLQGGGVIAYPTEAVYGLGCDPLNAQAVQRILDLKRRASSKGMILIAADYRQIRPFIQPLGDDRMQEIRASWPGPNTWILPAAANAPAWLTGGRDTIAVRVTAHPIAAALCRAAEMPLVSTSANLSSQPPARSALQVYRLFDDRLDLIISGATGGALQPTCIRDGRSGAVLRA